MKTRLYELSIANFHLSFMVARPEPPSEKTLLDPPLVNIMEHQMAVNSRTVHTLEKQENEMK
jgi:hypothetical protein